MASDECVVPEPVLEVLFDDVGVTVSFHVNEAECCPDLPRPRPIRLKMGQEYEWLSLEEAAAVARTLLYRARAKEPTQGGGPIRRDLLV